MDYKLDNSIFSSQKKRFLENDEPTPLQEQIFFFNCNFEKLASDLLNKSDDKTVISEMIGFLSKFDKLFFSTYNEIIPNIIEKKTFEIILNQVDDMHSLIFPVFKEISHCQTENLYLLLQNNFCHVHISSMFDYDDSICQCSVECLIEILSRNNFFYSLILSTNIIEKILHFMNQINNDAENFVSNNKQKICYCLIFLTEFFNYGPMPDEYICNDSSNTELLNQYQSFIRNCQNPELFNDQLFKEFLNNGISVLSQKSIFYQLLEIISQLAYSKYTDLINNYLCMILYIIKKNILTANVLLFKFPFYDCFDGWIENQNIETFNLVVKISCNLFRSNLIINEIYVKLTIHIVFNIFNYFLNKKEYSGCESEDELNEEEEEEEIDNKEQLEDLEYGTVTLLSDMVLNKFSQDKCVKRLIKRKEKILNQFINAPFYITRAYAYLILSIATNSNSYIEFLQSDVLDRIFSLMDKKKGEFFNFALDSFESIFRKQQDNQLHDFLDAFQNCQGVEFLYYLLDSTNEDKEDEEAHKRIDKIIDNYFSNKD